MRRSPTNRGIRCARHQARPATATSSNVGDGRLGDRPLGRFTISLYETDIRCARRARPRDPRGRPRADGGRLVPRQQRRQGGAGRPQRSRQDDPDQGARRRSAARRRPCRPLGRARLPAAGPAYGRSRDARAHAHPRRARPGHPGARHARGIARDGRRERRCRGQGDEALQQPHRAFRSRSAATPPKPRLHRSPTTSRCPTASSISRCAPSPAVSAAASSSPGSCSRMPNR